MYRAVSSGTARLARFSNKRFYSAATTGGNVEPYIFQQLENKAKVVTNPLPGHFSALGVYMNAGSRFEDSTMKGVSHLIDKLAFNSTESFDGASMLRNLESLGGNYMCSSSRESMMYQASVFNNDVEKMLELFSETIIKPRLTNEEIEEQKNFASYEIDEIWKKPDLILPELFHMVAYGGETLGSPLLCPPERLPMITKNIIEEYRRQFFNPENATIAFIGVDQDKALKLSEKYFGNWESQTQGIASSYKPAKYLGGEFCLPSLTTPDAPELSYIYFGFEGLAVDDPDIYSVAILQTLLGGGGSFSAGGPGKGMYAKLYTQVLNKYGFIENCTAFNHAYADSGLLGISGACIPNGSPYFVEIMCQQLAYTFQKTASRDGISEVELNRSKNQLKSSLLMNLESKMVELEDLGRQVQVHGKKVALSEMISKIDKVDLPTIRRVAERLMTGNASASGSGKPTIVIQGDREKFGDIEAVVKHYGLGK